MFCQKEPPWSGIARNTTAARWPSDACHLPPPVVAARLAAVGGGGTLASAASPFASRSRSGPCRPLRRRHAELAHAATSHGGRWPHAASTPTLSTATDGGDSEAELFCSLLLQTAQEIDHRRHSFLRLGTILACTDRFGTVCTDRFGRIPFSNRFI